MTDTPNLKERLLSASPVDPDLREQYESELKMIIHRQLRPGERWLYGIYAVIGVMLAIVFSIIAVRMDSPDIVIRLIAAVAAANCAAQGVRIGVIVYRGRFDRRKSHRWRIGTIYLAVVFGLWLAYAIRADRTGVPADVLILMLLPILVALIVFCMGWIGHLIAQAELRSREEMLEMKLQLVAMAKRLRKDEG